MRGWRRALRVTSWVAVGVAVGAIALSVTLAFVAQWLGGETEGAAYLVGMLVGLPAVLLLVPLLIAAAVIERSVNPAEGGKPIVASWDVSLDGQRHVVSLPSSRISPPDHAWVDGQRRPLRWTPPGATTTAHAALDDGSFDGELTAAVDSRETTILAGVLALSAVMGAPVGGTPGWRYTLEVEGATVEAVPVREGERRS